MSATLPENVGTLVERIDRLRRERRAVILVHNYQLGEVQDVADFAGDSLDLSRRAAATDAKVIVFCGVRFMAETAKILAPDRTVLLPDGESGCPMADMIDGPQLRRFKAEHPDAAVVCYVNSTAEVKAECDVCCTSANAAKVVASLPADRELLFVPDRYLGGHVQRTTGRRMTLWPGYCPTHARILPEHVERRKREHPGAVVLAHPECRAEVTALADQVLSTGQMLRFVHESDATTFIVATELGILHPLQRDNPGKRFVPASEQAICPDMKRITLEKVLWSLEELQTPIEIPEETRRRAEASLRRMLDVA
ncbi:MAG: quinolinate synthase NadA [Deltaproteobacteria bacterium]|nr:quinolinate synthase NadA [Deltaproteobacteria bacterium]